MNKNIGKAVATIFVLSLLAKVVGFLKSIVQASFYGATFETDAFNVANGFVSNILYMLTMAISVAFVPLYIQYKNESNSLDNDNKGKTFATRIISILFLLAVFATVCFIIIAPVIIHIIAPSYSGHIAQLTVKYFRVLVLGFAFSLVAHMYSNLLNAEKVYGFSAFSSVINSVVIISFAVCFQEKLGVWALVISVPVSYFIQWIVLFLKGKNFASLSLKYGLRDDSVKKLIIQAAPVLLSQATVEINQVVDRALLTGINVGVLTSVSYAAVLYQFATTLISTPLSTVMFTEMSEAGAKSDFGRIKLILRSCYKFVFIICMPVVVSMFFCSFDIVKIVYGHGKFPLSALYQSSLALQMYGLCLLPVCIKSILNKAYYSLNDTRRPMVMGILEVIFKITLSVTLVKSFGIMGVVGSTAIASIALIIMMLYNFNKNYFKVLDISELKGYWKIAISVLCLVFVMNISVDYYIINHYVDFIVKSIFAYAFYFGLLTVLKEEMYSALKYKFMESVKKRFLK